MHVGAELDVTARRGSGFVFGRRLVPARANVQIEAQAMPSNQRAALAATVCRRRQEMGSLANSQPPRGWPPSTSTQAPRLAPQHVRFEHAERRVDLCSGGARCPRARTCRSKHKCGRASGALPWRRVRGEAIRMWDCAQPAAPRLAPPQHADRSLNVGVSPPGERVKGRVDFWSGGA